MRKKQSIVPKEQLNSLINNNKKITKSDYKPPDKKQSYNEADLEKKVTQLVNQKMNNNIFELSSTDIQIAKEYALGKTDKEILKIDEIKVTQFHLDYLKTIPAFITEVQKLTSQTGMVNSSIREAMAARIGGMLFDDLINNPEQIAEMQTKDKIKLWSELAGNFDKKQSEGGGSQHIDITVVMKDKGINEGRLKGNKDGTKYVESNYPILDENGNIVGEYSE